MSITKQDFDLLLTIEKYKKEDIGWYTTMCQRLFDSLKIPKDSECYVFTQRVSGDKLSFNLNTKLILRLDNPKNSTVSVNIRIKDADKYDTHPAFVRKTTKFAYSESLIIEFYLDKLKDDSQNSILFEDILMASKDDLNINSKTIWRKHTSPLLTHVILDGSDVFERLWESNRTVVEFVLKEIFNSDPLVQYLKSNPEFYLQKAKDLLLDLLNESISQDLVDKVTTEYVNGSGVTFTDYVNGLTGEDKAYMQKIGELISYMDTHAAGKNTWNQYEDKRVIAKANVRQHRWIESIFSFLLSQGDLNSISSSSGKNALQFLRDPITGSSILSENHRTLLSKRVFDREYTSNEEFVNYQWELKSKLNLEVTNDENFTYAFGTTIYNSTFAEYWNPKKHKMNYYIIGSKYGENSDEDVYPQMKEGNFVCVGFDEEVDLSRYFTMTEKQSEKALKSLGLEQNSLNCLRKFVNIKPGDLIAVKGSGSPKGKNAYLSIIGIAKVLDTPQFYKHDPIGLGHKIEVEWLEKDIMREYGLGYGATLHKLDKKDHIDAIFNGSELHNYNSSKTQNTTQIKHPLNQILYGPPGTGKTYATVGMAVKIANPDFQITDNKAIKQEFQRLTSEGKIAFTTFHQSLGYEEFVEGIKPKVLEEDGSNITYEVQPGIFQKMAIDAAFDMVKDLESSKVKGIVGFTEKYDHLVSTLEEQLSSKSKVTIPSKSGGELIVADISSQRNILLKHHDDGQSYVVSKNRMKKLHTAFPDLSVLKNIDKEFRQVIGGSNSSAYWAVLNAISEIDSTTEYGPLDENEPIDFEAKREIVQEADHSKFQSIPTQNYVLIIDEINRGNVSKIFGELITLIEESKRLGRADYLRATLPYSSSGNDDSITFGVPPNLYIIGTMNTADRSVEALDTALRRRFSFTEIMPNPSVLDTSDHDGVRNLFGHNLSEILTTINNRIEVLLDRDHTIGHSYFMNLKDDADLIKVFTDNIIPLMQEYFYNDYSKIEMVMGSGFIGSTRNESEWRFAKTSNNHDIDLPDFSYHLIPIDENNIQEAIDSMMNIPIR